MKKLFMLLALAPLGAWGNYEIRDGIGWTFTIENGGATICRQNYFHPAIDEATNGAIVIPSRLGDYPGYPVMRIGPGAFQGCDRVTTVLIPASVIEIGDNAFSGCSSLTSITIPSAVVKIGDNAFSGCSALASIVVEAGKGRSSCPKARLIIFSRALDIRSWVFRCTTLSRLVIGAIRNLNVTNTRVSETCVIHTR